MDGLINVANRLKNWDENVLGDLQKRIKEKRARSDQKKRYQS
jgi:hypothetical protein